MFNTIFAKAIWDRKVSILAISSGMFFFALMFAALHQSFASEITTFADSFPPELGAIIGDISAAATPAGFLNVELYSLFLPFAVAIMGIAFAAKAIGKEEISGTLELLLASPISRSKIILQKLMAINLALLLVVSSAWFGVVVGKTFFVFDVNLVDVALASTAVYLLGMVYAMAAFAGQGCTGKAKIGVGVSAGLLVLTYFADVLSKLVDNLEALKYVSPFYYMDMASVLNGDGAFINFVVLFGTATIFYIVAHVGFINRDTGV